VNAAPVSGIVKVEEGAAEEEGGSEIELFGWSDPEDAEAIPDWLCTPHETDQVLTEGI
jgi:hypothetical protein